MSVDPIALIAYARKYEACAEALKEVYEALDGSRYSSGTIGSIAWYQEKWEPARKKMFDCLRALDLL